MRRLVLSRLEVALVVLCGIICVGGAAYLDDREERDKADPSLDPDEIAASLGVPRTQAKIAAIDQRLTALRTQAIASSVEAMHRRTEMTVLSGRFPGLRSAAASAPGAAPELVAAARTFDADAVAVELNTALSRELDAEIAKSDTERTGLSTELRQAQRDAAARLIRQKRERDRAFDWSGFWFRWVRAALLAALAGLFARAFATPERERFAFAAVFVTVVVIAQAVIGYYTLPLAAALVGVVAGVLVLAIAIRSVR